MDKKLIKETKIKSILEKTERKLRKLADDPDVLDYNYYNDSKFVGAKVMRNKKITLEQVAEDLAVLTKLVIEGFATTNKRLDGLEDFAVKQLAFNEGQRKINEEQKKYNKKIDRIEILVELMASTPTMKRELKELEEKDKK